MVGGLLALVMLRPCLPFEIGGMPTAAPPAPVALPSPPAPAVRPIPAPLATAERARYRIAYGPLDVGELSLSLSPGAGSAGAGAGTLVRASGQGSGRVLGLGRMDTQVETQFDGEQLTSRRWTSTRMQNGRATRDTIEQPAAGRLELERSRDGGPVSRSQALLAAPAFDPIGLLLRFRAAPPAPGSRPEVLDLLDGQAHWRVTVAHGGRQLREGRPAVRLEGRAEPVYADGRPDGGRTARTFSLWLSDDAARVPLAFEMPVGLGDLVISLVQVERPAPPAKRWLRPPASLFARRGLVLPPRAWNSR